jgi:CRP-like cAMP-binding protein
VPVQDLEPALILAKRLSLHQGLLPEDLAGIERLPILSRTLDQGDHVFREQDRSTQCCLVLSGVLCRYKFVSGGGRQILSVHVPGDIPDLHSLHIETMDHSLGTLAPSSIGLIQHGDIEELIRTRPRIGAALWRESLIDAAIGREWAVGLGRRSAYSRLAHFFCEFYLRMKAVGLVSGPACRLPLTQADIADVLGLTAVHINRSLKQMRADQAIAFQGRLLTILNWDLLRSAGEFDPTYLHLSKAILEALA